MVRRGDQSTNKLATVIPLRAATHELPSERGLSPREVAGAVHTNPNEQAGAVRAVLEYTARAVTATVSAEGRSVARTPMRPTIGRQPM